MSLRQIWQPVFIVSLILEAGPFLAHAQQPAAGQRDQYDAIVDAFIAYDVGQLNGQRGLDAYNAFQALNDEAAIPALVRGVMKAAKINNSCPIVVLSGKLQQLLQKTNNKDQIAFAFHNLNEKNGMVYGSYVQSLKEFADRRHAEVANTRPSLSSSTVRGGGTAGQLRRSRIPISEWTLQDLMLALVEEQEAALLPVLEELKIRKGAEYTKALTESIGIVPNDLKPLARGMLAQRLSRMTDDTLREMLNHESVEVRAAAARAVGYKGAALYQELALALRDKDDAVGGFAHDSLVKLTGEDLGPEGDSPTFVARYEASRRWEAWVANNHPTGRNQ